MHLTRRTFLGGFTAAATVPSLFAAAKPAVDPNLSVLLSDIHIPGSNGKGTYQRTKFDRVIADILKLDPLPAHALVFGDLAHLYGRKADYLESQPQLKLLEDAGVKVTIAMGNHDRRSAFLEVYGAYAKTTKIPGRIVSIVDLGAADFILLDGLQGTDDRGATDMGPGTGALNKDQQDWLLAELPKWKKPVFVGSHFPVKELSAGGKPLKDLLLRSPNVAGYIHGHDHRWYKEWYNLNWSSTRILRTLCLPSAGFWGDIGYTLLRVSNDRAVARLHQYEYFFPKPQPQRPEDKVLWNAITAENQHAFCTFALPQPA